MKLPKLLKRSQELLSDNKNNAEDRKKCLKEIQRKLKKKARRLEEKILQEKNDDQKSSLRKDLAIVRAQRKKVISELKKLKQEKDSE